MLKYLARYLRNWFPTLVFLLLWLVLAGWIGQGLGFPYLFRDDPQLLEQGFWVVLFNSPLVWGHAGATLLILAIWTGAYLQDELTPGSQEKGKPDPLFSFKEFRPYIFRNSILFLALLPLAAILGSDGEIYRKLIEGLESLSGIAFGLIIAIIAALMLNRWILGTIGNLVGNMSSKALQSLVAFLDKIENIFIKTLMRKQKASAKKIADFFKEFSKEGQYPRLKYALRILLYAAIIVVGTFLFVLYPRIAPGVALCIVLIWLVGFYFILSALPAPLRTSGLIAIALLFWFTGSDPYANKFPDFKNGDHDPYADPLQVEEIPKDTSPNDRIGSVASLEKWKHYVTNKKHFRQTHCQKATAQPLSASNNQKPNPKLIIISASGGAYRSGFWVAKVLDSLIKEHQDGKPLKGLAYNVRILTGASGGMVGSSYFAKLAPDPCQPGKNWQAVVEKSLL